MSGSIGIDNLDSEYQVTRDNTGTIVSRATQTVAGTSVDFLPGALNDQTTHVLWQVLDADIKVALDGATATAATGVLLEDKASTIWSRSFAESSKAIRAAGTSAIITVYELQKGSPQTTGV